MKKTRTRTTLCVLCASVMASYVMAAGQETPLKPYKPVTAQRLLKPDDGDWLMIRRTYDGWGYSPLDKINTSNVSKLKPMWMIETGEARVHESAPIVNGGVMFVTTPNNQVIALDAKTGAILWRYKRPRIAGALVPHDTNRGVALYGSNVYFATGESDRRRTRCADRKGTVDGDGRRQQGGVLHLARAARGQRQSDGRHVGRRIRRARVRRRARSGHRQRAVAHVHDSRSRRAGTRHLARRRRMEARRRADLGDRQLRSGDEPRLLGHRQRRTVDGRCAPGRQPLYDVGDRTRRHDRRAQRPLPISSERRVGLGRGVAAHPRRFQTQWQNRQRSDRRRAQRLFVVSRTPLGSARTGPSAPLGTGPSAPLRGQAPRLRSGQAPRLRSGQAPRLRSGG